MPGLVIGVTEFIDEMRGVLDQWVERFHLDHRASAEEKHCHIASRGSEMNEDEIEAKWAWTWVDAWRQVMKGDPSKMASLLLEDVPLTKSMREHLADLFRRGRVRPDPQESKANVTLLVAALHFRALEALRREENRSRDKDLPKRRPLRQRPRDSAGQSLRPWRVPVMFWLAVEDPIPEKTRRSLKGLSKDDLVDLVVRTYGVSEESLRNLLAGRSRLYREVRPYLLSSKPSV